MYGLLLKFEDVDEIIVPYNVPYPINCQFYTKGPPLG